MVSANDMMGLRPGNRGVVAGIDASQPGAKRLADLGFVRGASFTMVRTGKPCIVRIGDRCVGLGAGHQHSIRLLIE